MLTVAVPAGMYGQSSVREVDLATGTVLRQKAIAHSDFAEGLVKVGGRCGRLSFTLMGVPRACATELSRDRCCLQQPQMHVLANLGAL